MDDNYNFSKFIEPLNIKDFFQKYWETKYLYIARNNESFYKNILSYEDIDVLLQNKQLLAEDDNFLLVKEGKKIDYSLWTKKSAKANQYILDNDKVFDFLNQGVTLIINSGHKSIPKLIKFCNHLEGELKFRVRTNIYITPPTAQGLVPHYDEHDVCILQITGTKIWHLYHSPIELPSQKKDQMVGMHSLQEPELKVELKPGDFLYIPRGLVHQAFTTDTTSIHIALGFYPTYWFELLQDILKVAQDNPIFRKAIPHGFTDEDTQATFKEEFRQVCQSLFETLDIDSLLEKKSHQFMVEKITDDENRFNDWLQINKINLNTVLSRRRSILFSTEKDAKNICIKFYQKELVFPHFFAPSLATILYTDAFTVKDIGGLITDEGKINLASRFVKEGFLKIEKI